ncbi:MAG: glycosyltransferase family 39 protein [Chloroflexi bacterium]|nr:glycosyltransferase family 39 protein [Chloroflexota bacterium]
MIGLLFVAAGAFWLWLPARRLLHGSPHFAPLTFFSGLGLSLGAISILMMWIGLAPTPLLIAPIILSIPIIGVAASLPQTLRVFKTLRVSPIPNPTSLRYGGKRLQSLISNYQLLLSLTVSITVIIIAINSISYPFYRYDTITRFAPNARTLLTLARIPESLTGYPLGMQMLYTFGFMAAGGVNDHFAGIFVALTALGMIGCVYLSTRLIFNERAALCATILAISSPVFVDWATSGYVDVPEGFYHGLTFIFALLWLQRGETRYAILAGVMAGFALWIKQSSLVLIPSLAVVPLLRLFTTRDFKKEFLLGMSALLPLVVIGVPWYARSYLMGANVFPAPSTYDELFIDRSLSAFITFWHRRDEWGLPFGITTLFGFVLLPISFIARRRSISNHPTTQPPNHPTPNLQSLTLLLAFTLPYHFLWWWQFTYQARYLLVSLPMYAALAGFACDWLLNRLPFKFPTWSAALISLALMFYGAYPRLGAVYHLLRDPLQNDDVKLTRLARDQWLLSKKMIELAPRGAKVMTMDGALAYWLYDYQLDQGYPTRFDDLRSYDYFITAPWGGVVQTALGHDDQVSNLLNDSKYFINLYDGGENWAIYQIKK